MERAGERAWRGIVYLATSLDGFIARTDDEIDWLEPDATITHAASVPGPGHQASYDALIERVDVMVMGRRTYDKVLTFDEWPYPIPVLVLSATMPEGGDDRVEVVRSLQSAVERLGEVATRGVYIDGGLTVQAFLEADLVDEITVTTVPVIIGTGIPLFGALGRDVKLSLQHVEAEGGYLSARYDVVR